jgi:hypothetical protein
MAAAAIAARVDEHAVADRERCRAEDGDHDVADHAAGLPQHELAHATRSLQHVRHAHGGARLDGAGRCRHGLDALDDAGDDVVRERPHLGFRPGNDHRCTCGAGKQVDEEDQRGPAAHAVRPACLAGARRTNGESGHDRLLRMCDMKKPRVRAKRDAAS